MNYGKINKDQKILTCASSTTVIEAARLMEQDQIDAVMIVEDGGLIGIFTERDALFRVIAKGRDAQSTQLTEVMTRNPQTIHPDKPFGHALHLMYEGSFRHVPVVENGQPIGMVSARDGLGPELEDFVYELLRREQIEQVLA
jgi:signal-transduction protein with cAMP-binding, CBS, and nucleotidyltransferase domain